MKIVVDTEDLFEFAEKVHKLFHKLEKDDFKEGYYIDSWVKGKKDHAFISKTKSGAFSKLAKDIFSKDGKWETIKDKLEKTLSNLKDK